MNQKAHEGWIMRSYWGFAQGAKFLGHFLLLAIRLYWGGRLVLTGLGKWMNIHGVSEFFASIDIPLPLFSAYLVGTVEFLGGLALFFGLFSRIFSILLIIVFIVAYATAHTEALTGIFVNPSLFTAQEPFLFLYASLVVLCFGPGFISFDYWMEKRAYGNAL